MVRLGVAEYTLRDLTPVPLLPLNENPPRIRNENLVLKEFLLRDCDLILRIAVWSGHWNAIEGSTQLRG